jgi:hypothetical protein
MSDIASADAGLVGFKLAKAHPMAIPAWAIFSLVSSVLITVLLITMAGPALMEMQQYQPGPNPDPADLARIYGGLGQAGLVVLPLSLVFGGIIYAAASRLVLKPEDRGFGWLKLGADEFRQMLVLLVVWILMFLAYLAVVVLVAVVAAVGSMVAPILGVLLASLGVIAAIGAMFYLAVRLSLASPATFASGRLSIGESWRLTKGKFWPLFGAYIIAFIMTIIVSLAAMAVFFVVAGIPFGFSTVGATMMSPDMSSTATMFTGVGIAYFIWSAIVSGFTNLLFLTPAPTLYAQIKGVSADSVFE